MRCEDEGTVRARVEADLVTTVLYVANKLWLVMTECEGRRFGQESYDMTLDDIYDNVQASRALLLELLELSL